MKRSCVIIFKIITALVICMIIMVAAKTMPLFYTHPFFAPEFLYAFMGGSIYYSIVDQLGLFDL